MPRSLGDTVWGLFDFAAVGSVGGVPVAIGVVLLIAGAVRVGLWLSRAPDRAGCRRAAPAAGRGGA